MQWLIVPEITMALVVLTAIPVLNIFQGVGEARGENLGWGKFCDRQAAYVWTSQGGWTLAYFPAAAVSAVLMAMLKGHLNVPHPGMFSGVFLHRVLLVTALLTLHWFKRLIEVRYLHRYHNGIEAWLAVTQAAVNTAISCQLIYFTYTVPAELYDQHLVPTPWFMKPLSKGMPDMLPFWVLVGCLTWAAGEALSLYHHQLLSTLRADRSAAYAPPAGGLFALVWCPHYLFELVAWAGIVILTQHPQPLVVWLAMCSFLGGRAIATRAWYQRRMGAAFPAGRRCIVPFLL